MDLSKASVARFFHATRHRCRYCPGFSSSARITLWLVLILLAGTTLSPGEGRDDKKVRKILTNRNYGFFTINNLFNWYMSDGESSINFETGMPGLEFPKGSMKHVILEDGIVWGGNHKGQAYPKISGSTYYSGLQPGAILTPGGLTENEPPVADDPSLEKYRVYVVRPDVTPTTPFVTVQPALEAEAALINRYTPMSAQQLYDKYVNDWNEWPAKDGLPAPYEDKNGDRVYDPAIDIPGRPGADQTLYYVANDANDTLTQQLYCSAPIGLEMHKTVWGYNRTDALGNMIFTSTVIINKSGAALDSMYIAQWSDPDLGSAVDDFAGCDPSRNLGFVYNGTYQDADYGVAVPAVGHVILQGPIAPTGNPSDSAIFLQTRRRGYTNLGMTRFLMFTCGSNLCEPDFGCPADPLRNWYAIMSHGFPSVAIQQYCPSCSGSDEFPWNGDPVTGSGWIDGTNGLRPGDRKIALVSGPFSLADRDTQEILVATIVGQGGDRLSSIAVLRWYRDIAQNVYKGLFNIPIPPPTPKPEAAALDKEIVLNWVDTQGIEQWNSSGYAFEGYNVYQFPGPSADITGAVRVATYDLADDITTIFDNVYDVRTGYVIIKPVEFGTDTGLKRTFETTTDAITATPLTNGDRYYFGVTSYSYKENATPAHLESAPDLITIVPHAPDPGTLLNASYNQTVPVTHTVGISTAIPTVTIVDPTRLRPSDYEIQIVVTDSVFSNDLGKNVANPKWQLFDLTENRLVLTPRAEYNTVNEGPIGNGMKLSLVGSPFYIYGKELDSAVWTGPSPYNFAWVIGGIFVGNDFFGPPYGILNPPDVSSSVEFVFTDKAHGQNAYDYVRASGTGSTGSHYTGYFPQPFTVWELNGDGTHRRQLDFVFMEATDFSDQSTYDSVWAPGPSASNREYWFVVGETYSTTEKAKYAGTTLGAILQQDSVLWNGWQTLLDSNLPAYVPGDDWKLLMTNIVTAQDRWRFSTKATASTYSESAARADVGKINVFPNPYLNGISTPAGGNDPGVMFSRLPRRVTIRIFTLAGTLTRMFVKDDPSQFVRWDLRNEGGRFVAPGIYLVYIEIPDLGMTRVLKVGVWGGL